MLNNAASVPHVVANSQPYIYAFFAEVTYMAGTIKADQRRCAAR